MKKSLLFGCYACIVGVHTNAVWGLEAVLKACTETVCSNSIFIAPTGCTAGQVRCFSDSSGRMLEVMECTSCMSGYELTAISSVCGSTSVIYNTCEESCVGCKDCESDIGWSWASTKHEQKVTRECDCNTCIEFTSYRCAAGYYGRPINGLSGCTRCTSLGTSAAGSTAETDCFIPADSNMTDDTGTYHFTDDCYYSN